MAAIIAKITRENRERIKRRKNTWGIRKSRYSLGSFKDHFDPEEDVKVFNYHLGCRFYNLVLQNYLNSHLSKYIKFFITYCRNYYSQLSVALSGNGDLLAVAKIDNIA